MSDEKQAPSEMVEVLGRLLFGDADPDAVTSAEEIAAALDRLGYIIVPVEPTAEMWAAVNLIERGHVSKICSVEGWRAMLEAAEKSDRRLSEMQLPEGGTQGRAGVQEVPAAGERAERQFFRKCYGCDRSAFDGHVYCPRCLTGKVGR
jgi:hypothetical protein